MSDVREKQLPLNLFRESQWICMNLQIHEVNFNCHPFAGVLPSPRFVLHLWGFCRVGKPRPALRASGIIFMWGLMYVAICVCMHVNCMYIYISICMHVNCMYACKLHVCTYMYILITVIRITVAIHAINWLPYIVHTWSLRIPPYKTNCMNIFYLKVFWGLIPTPATCIETVAKKWRATETAQTHRK